VTCWWRSAGGVPDLRELADKAREIADRIPPRALLRQAELCAGVIEALRQNGTGGCSWSAC